MCKGRWGYKAGEGSGENRSRKLIFCVNTKYQCPALNGTADALERYSDGIPVPRRNSGTPTELRRYSDGTPVLRRNSGGSLTVLLRYSRHCEGTAAVLRRNSGGTPTERRRNWEGTDRGLMRYTDPVLRY